MEQTTSEHPPQQHNEGSDNSGGLEHSSPKPDSDFCDDRTAFERLTYAVSLNYNKLATSIFYPVTGWHWYDPIRNTVCILGAVPSHQDLVNLSTTYNVRHVINMCAEFPGHLDTMKKLSMQQCYIPTKDFHTPSIESLWRGVKYIEDVTTAAAVAATKAATSTNNEAEASSPSSLASTSSAADAEQPLVRIYLHCKAGRGRSASVAICWLVYDYDLTLAQAQKILLSCRGQSKLWSRKES
ncbi:hypothetical protein DFQ27_008758 [Actinomortierella ambigua]|uniref:Tyrosine specific protein phosphatases domain-containing protein n=1 Tax=Actinomortierella ambigua TaxID=1343610 RepID=A0A9P6UBF3_9FUNG|nr:hypothetical protein DFQ27_008758 [Actinomortierella ambigua]